MNVLGFVKRRGFAYGDACAELVIAVVGSRPKMNGTCFKTLEAMCAVYFLLFAKEAGPT